MTPLDLAANLARSDDPNARALAVAMVARGLSDDDPATFRQGWPLSTAIAAAFRILNLPESPALIAAATIAAPTVSDAMLNR